MSTTLRVTAIQIRDVLGAREFNMAPGRITTLAGANGSGKSSALAAVQSALGGGNLAKIARVGAEGEKVEPEVVLLLEGPGTEAYRVERKGDKVRVRARVLDTAAFEDVGRPQTWLRSLYDPDGANPVAFLMAKDDARATMLLEALPLKYTRAELLAAMDVLSTLPPIAAGLHPLEEIDTIRHAVFNERTGVNRDHKQQLAAAEQLLRNIPAVVPDDHADELARLRAQREEAAATVAADRERAKAAEDRALASATSAHAREEDRIAEAFKSKAARLRAAHAEKAAAVRAEAERQIRDLAGKVDAEIEDLRAADSGALDVNDRKRDEVIRAARTARAAHDEQLAQAEEALRLLVAGVAELETRAEGASKARALAEQAKQFSTEAKRLEEESDRLTAALDALDAFRRNLAKDLPIEGLTVEGKQIRVAGVLYEHLNTAQRVDIAVQVACLRAKENRLPVVFVDGAEALDSEHFEILVDRLKTAGVQAFLGRVEDTELRVIADGQETEALAR